MKRFTLLRVLRKRTGRVVDAALAQAYATLVSPLVCLLASRARVADMLARNIVRDVEELDQDGQAGPLSPAQGRLSILALSHQEFRRDLEMLAARRELRILRLPLKWQTRLMRWFYGVWPTELDVHNPAPGSGAARAQSRYRYFLRNFLPQLYPYIGVDVVVGANVRYPEDIDWGVTSQQLGVPYVVFHRENLPAMPGSRAFERMKSRYQSFGHFKGECIAVHNTSTPIYLREANYSDADRIHVLGCLRMDPYLRRLRLPRPTRARPLVVLFSFRSDSPSTFGRGGYYPPFRDCHGALARLAKEHPEVDVLIKPKPKIYTNRNWNLELTRAFRDWGVDPDNLPPNLRVDPNSDAQDLILSASVVVALNSTTLIEAGVAGLPVIMPDFRYLREGPHSAAVRFREHGDLFDVPETGEDLIEMVLHRLRDPSIPREVMQGRERFFADAVSPLDGNATERYLQLLQRVATGVRAPNVASR